MTDTTLRLFRASVEAGYLRFSWTPSCGWEAVINTRRSGEGWGDDPGRRYSHLSTPELVDVLLAELEVALGEGERQP